MARKIKPEARWDDVLRELEKTYPNARCELDHRNAFELLVATILSAQCTDKRVNMVTPRLFENYPDSFAMSEARLTELEAHIYSTGFYKNKAKNLKACCAELVSKHGGEVPRTMGELKTLAGVGRKTANVVLGNVFGINEGIVVDTHVSRLSQRLGFTVEASPEKIERSLMAWVPREKWTLFSHWLILHGRSRCMARNPDCGGCEIRGLCPWSEKVMLEKSREPARAHGGQKPATVQK